MKHTDRLQQLFPQNSRVKFPRNMRLAKAIMLIGVTGLAGMASLGMAGCDGQSGQKSDKEAPKPIEVQVQQVEVAHLPVFIEASGSMLADETMTISAKVAGRVLAVNSDLGDQVKPADLLATIDPTDYKLAILEKTYAMDQTLAQLGLTKMPEGEVDNATLPSVRRAASQESNAHARLDRLQKLHTQKLVSDQDFNDAQTAAEVAKSEYDVAVLSAQAILATARTRQAELVTARQQLADTKISVPEPSKTATDAPDTTMFLVAERMTSLGEYVSQATPLFRLVDDNPIRLRMAVPERYSAKVATGQPVAVRVQAFNEPFEGKVTRISPEINPANRTFLVEVSIANPDHRLKPGGFAMGAIEIQADRPAILVSQKAVTTFAGVSKVFAVKEGKTQEMIVQLGDEIGDKIEVTKGLDDKSEIISPLPSRTTANLPVIVSQAGGNKSSTSDTAPQSEPGSKAKAVPDTAKP